MEASHYFYFSATSQHLKSNSPDDYGAKKFQSPFPHHFFWKAAELIDLMPNYCREPTQT